MKLTKIYSGIMALLMGAAMLTACSDEDDYSAATTPLLSDGSVVTGSADVTATSATFYGTVTGLDNVSSASYSTGFYYGSSQDALTQRTAANVASSFSATLSDLAINQVVYYQAYVTLQGRVTYKGEVKQLITTDAKAVTGDASGIDYAQATLAGSASQFPDDAIAGIVISASSDQETVRAGLRLDAATPESYSITKAGLLPATTYYYAAFLDLGAGIVYGDVKQFTTSTNEINVDDEFVDLGLSVKWAKRNIGAKTETDFGGLFGFGDLTGVNPSINPDDFASAETYRTTNDLAYQVTGGKGTLPTADLFEELFRLSKTEWVEQDGVAGYKVTGPNGNSIFLPAAGKRVASTVSDEGVRGYYLTGSVNVNNTQFAVDYEITKSTTARATRAAYEALSVRPVSTARNVKFDKTKLFKTWCLDVTSDGAQAYFAGPLYYYGTDDSWGSVSNNEAVIGDSWNWSPAWSDISGWIGFAGRNYGSMTLREDGTVTVVSIADDGTETTENGTFTLDEKAKTITLTVGILAPAAVQDMASNRTTQLRILTLNDDGVQIAVVRDSDPCLLSLNYVPESAYKALSFPAEKLYRTWHLDIAFDGSSQRFVGPLGYYGTDDSWNTVTNGVPVDGDSWNWTPDYAGNSWILGDQSPRDFGRMTLREDGTVTVTRIAADGTVTSENGTYTVDKAEKTISLTVDILGLPNMQALTLSNKTNLRILSLTDETLQIAILRDPELSGEGACLLAFNYVSDEVYNDGFALSDIYNTWHIDILPDGSSLRAVGPLSYYGTGDWWGNVTEGGAPLNDDSWNWDPDYAGNSWVLGDAAPRDFGTMTLREDGTVTVTRISAEGEQTTENGTFTLNPAEKTISLTVDILGLPNMQALTLTNQTNLHILKLAEDALTIAIVRDPELSGEGACQLAFNYVTDGLYKANARKRVGSRSKRN